MASLKEMIQSLGEEERGVENEIEVYADSIRQGLELAAEEFGVDISMLDYDVAEKGSAGIFGFGRLPYKLYVRAIDEEKAFG
ncbi:MAG: Jag N-terminal domain-containing protein, partial [Spirochaetota bacterium]